MFKKLFLLFVAAALVCLATMTPVAAKGVENVAATMVSTFYDQQDLTAELTAGLSVNGFATTEIVQVARNGDAVLAVLTVDNNEFTASNQMTSNADPEATARNGCAEMTALSVTNAVNFTAYNDLVTGSPPVAANLSANLMNVYTLSNPGFFSVKT